MPNSTCNRNCWIAAAVLGLLIWIFTAGFGPLGWFAGLFLGLITAGLFGLMLVWLVCSGTGAEDAASWQPADPVTPDSAPQPRGVPSDAAVGFVGGDGSAASPDAPVAPSGDAQVPPRDGEAAGAERTDIYGKSASAPADDKPAAAAAKPAADKKKPAGGDADDKATAKDSAAAEKPADKKPADKKPAAKKPAGKKAAASEADDLKQIKGVGPKLEELLNDNGVTQFAQIAEWDDAEIDRFADLIGRAGGRIRSDDWVSQARTLAAGGETEFSKRVEEGDVY